MAADLAIRLTAHTSLTATTIGDIVEYTDENSVTTNVDLWIPAEDITIMHDKSPIVSALPDTEPILIDLGQWKVSIPLNGFVDKEYIERKSQDSVNIANRRDLEEIAANNQGPNWHTNHMVLRDYSNGSSNILRYVVKVDNISISTQSGFDWASFKLNLTGYLHNSRGGV